MAEEFIHSIEGTESYTEFVKFVKDLAENTEDIDVKAEKAEIKRIYDGAGVKYNLEREFTAQMAAKLLFNDAESVEYLVKNRQSVAGRFFDFLSHYSAKLTGNDEKATVLQARRLLSQALRESEDMEEQLRDRNLFAASNLREEEVMDALDLGEFVMPSFAVTRTDIGHDGFGDFSVLVKRDVIDPRREGNKLYGSDAWTPSQTKLKVNPVFRGGKTEDFISDIQETLGDAAKELFDYTPSEFQKAIAESQGSIQIAFVEHEGMQAAYALKEGLIDEIPMKNGEVDSDTLHEIMKDIMDRDGVWRKYKEYLANVSDDVIESYDKASYDDIIKSMYAQPATAKKFNVSTNGFVTVPAVEFSSIEEAKRKKNRLSKDADEASKAVGREMLDWASSIAEKTGTEADAVRRAVNASYSSRYDTSEIKSVFANRGIDISASDAITLQNLYKKALELPSKYFEAKPRKIKADDIAAVVIPSNASDKVRAKLSESGIKYVEYPAGDSEARLKAIKEFDDIRFSISRKKATMEDAQKLFNDLTYNGELTDAEKLREIYKKDPSLFGMLRDVVEGERTIAEEGKLDYAAPYDEALFIMGLVEDSNGYTSEEVAESIDAAGWQVSDINKDGLLLDAEYAINCSENAHDVCGEIVRGINRLVPGAYGYSAEEISEIKSIWQRAYKDPEGYKAELEAKKAEELAAMEEPEEDWNIPENGDTVTERAIKSAKKTIERYRKQEGIVEGFFGESSEGDFSTGIKFEKSLKEYPEEKQKTIKDYLSSVNKFLLQKVEYFRNNKDAKFERINLSEVKEKERLELEKLLGVNVEGYIHAINSSSLTHIEKRHGKNGKHDKSMANASDVARVEYVLDNYDSIEILKKDGKIVYSNEFNGKNNTQAPLILYTKKIDGTYYAAVAVAENSYKKLWVASAYTAKTKEDITQVLHDEISSLGTTSETAPASLSSISNISQKSGDVKGGEPHANAESREIIDNALPDINDGKGIDEVTAEMSEQHRARFKTKSKAEFDAMPDTDKLKAAGVTGISGSVGLYGQTEQAIEQKQAERTTAKARKEIERVLSPDEIKFAKLVSRNEIDAKYVPESLRREMVLELAETDKKGRAIALLFLSE